MKKVLLIFAMLIFTLNIYCDEGMWQPYMLNKTNLAEMQRLGCKLTAEQIFDLKKSSLKDAIAQFGGGCTAELISDKGLLLTNHHCGIGYVQNHSTIEHDYLTDGFWAYNMNEELINEGLLVYFLNDVFDVTDKILANINDDITEQERSLLIDENIEKYVKSLGDEKKVKVEIVPFYHGNQYLYFEYNVYSDVRLVACPPWGIGKYGADTDNWTWPRHKGDFCIFRVYTAPDGSPADYSKENIPMKPKHYLPISLKGVKQGDFAMILGYPGSTDRYSSSQNVKLIIDEIGPSIIKCRTAKLDVYRKHMDANKEVFIKYASKQASVSNYWKYYIGQVSQLKRNKVVEKRLAQEAEFSNWIKKDNNRFNKYKDVLNYFKEEYQTTSQYQKIINYYLEAGITGSEAIRQSLNFRGLNNLIIQKKTDSYNDRIKSFEKTTNNYFTDYDFNLDKEATTVLLNLFYKDIPQKFRPELINKIGAKSNGDFSKYIDKAFAKSIFTDQNRMNEWLKNPKSLTKDPIFELCSAFYNGYLEVNKLNYQGKLIGEKASRLYMAGLMEMYKDQKNFYPNANFTMRLTYGTVDDYKPADGVMYSYESTLDGVMEKYIKDNWEFDLPEKLIELYNKKDYGEYADENGNIIVNFITTNDITGGNSGSPVLDAEGNLIGLAFDGNWEAMSGDISFENEVQRTINVDARFLIFVIDKIGNAQNIIDELTIIR